MEQEKKILIIGGGFAGMQCALDLSKKNLSNTKITLVSDKTHFEFHPTLYRVVTGKTPLEVCIPLRDIFEGRNVEVLQDFINDVDLNEGFVTGSSGSDYRYDFLVLTLGSQTVYFNIPGLEENSFGFKSINEALKLKNHLHKTFSDAAKHPNKDIDATGNLVILGGGASGVELAGELITYSKKLAKNHKIDPNKVSVEIVDRESRLLPMFSEKVSNLVTNKLKSLGVKVHLNTEVVKDTKNEIFFKDSSEKTKTVIWTAGVMGNELYKNTKGLTIGRGGKVEVNEYLNPKDYSNVFVGGDGALTQYSGSGQTAVFHGKYIANAIARKVQNKKVEPYIPHKPKYVIPIGESWGVAQLGGLTLSGWVCIFLRKAADLRMFLSILSVPKALKTFSKSGTLCEVCEICNPQN